MLDFSLLAGRGLSVIHTKERSLGSPIPSALERSEVLSRKSVLEFWSLHCVLHQRGSTLDANMASIKMRSLNLGSPMPVRKTINQEIRACTCYMFHVFAFHRLKRSSGMSSLLGKIGAKKQKMSTLEKSKLDWESFKEEEGIGEELAIHNRGKEG